MVMANRADPGISAASIEKIRANAPRKANSHQLRDNEHAVLTDTAFPSSMATFYLLDHRRECLRAERMHISPVMTTPALRRVKIPISRDTSGGQGAAMMHDNALMLEDLRHS
ncbi:MAG: hypothetical protein ACK4IS_05130 [Erythrobacter sp.]